MSVNKVEDLLRLAPAVVSLDTPVGNDGVTLGDLYDDRPRRPPEHVEVHGLSPEDVEPLLQTLDPREADIIRRRFGLPPYDELATLEQIGRDYAVTRERIRQIESTAMTNLRVLVGLEQPKKRKRRRPKPGLAVTA